MDKLKYVGYGIIGLSLVGLYIAYSMESYGLLFAFIGLLLVSIFGLIFVMSVQMFQKDKELDLELIKESNLTLVECSYCHKKNVLEDQYCIHCGEKLEEK